MFKKILLWWAIYNWANGYGPRLTSPGVQTAKIKLSHFSWASFIDSNPTFEIESK